MCSYAYACLHLRNIASKEHERAMTSYRMRKPPRSSRAKYRSKHCNMWYICTYVYRWLRIWPTVCTIHNHTPCIDHYFSQSFSHSFIRTYMFNMNHKHHTPPLLLLLYIYIHILPSIWFDDADAVNDDDGECVSIFFFNHIAAAATHLHLFHGLSLTKCWEI